MSHPTIRVIPEVSWRSSEPQNPLEVPVRGKAGPWRPRRVISRKWRGIYIPPWFGPPGRSCWRGRRIIQPAVIGSPAARRRGSSVMLGLAGAGPPKLHVTVWPGTRGRIACSQPTDREIEMFLRLGIRALRMLTGRLLKRGEWHPEPFRQKAQVYIATERPLMAELTQEIAHAVMILEIPRRQVLG